MVFFEWQHHEEQKKKQPYFIEERHHELLAVAALWDWYKQPHQEATPSFCLLTKEATSPTVKALHERMPWILSPFQAQEWLKEDDLSFNRLHELIEMDNSIDLIAYPVTPSVNSALYKEKDSLKPIK